MEEVEAGCRGSVRKLREVTVVFRGGVSTVSTDANAPIQHRLSGEVHAVHPEKERGDMGT